MLVNMSWRAIDSVCFRRKKVDSEQDASSVSHIHPRMESGRSYSINSLPSTSLCSGWPFAPPRTVDPCSGWPLPHHTPPVRVVGDHVFLESSKELVKEILEQTQEEHENISRRRILKYTWMGQFFRTIPRCNAERKWVVPGLQRINKTQNYSRSHDDKNFLRCVFWDMVFSRRTRLTASTTHVLGVQVPSPSQVASTTRRRTSIGETQWARQSPDFAPEIKGTHCVFYREVLQLASSIWKIPTCASGDRMHIISKPHRYLHPTDCTQARFSQTVHHATHCSPVTRERDRQFGATGHLHRRKTKVCCGIQRKKLARATDYLQRFHEDSQVKVGFPRHRRRLSMEVSHSISQEKAAEHRSERNRRRVLEQFWLDRLEFVFKLVGTRKMATLQPTFIQKSLFTTHSEPWDLQKRDRNTARADDDSLPTKKRGREIEAFESQRCTLHEGRHPSHEDHNGNRRLHSWH